MPIQIACTCGKKFAVKDEMAGRTVKCPRCSQPVVVPSAATTGDEYGLSELFDEAGMKAAPAGAPRCPSCGAATTPGAIICIECGYNAQLGRRMETYAEADGGGSHAEQLVRKAERELEKAPLTQSEEEYGEGASSYLVTCGMAVLSIILIGIGGVAVLILSTMVGTGEGQFNPAIVTFFVCLILLIIGRIWLVVAAFMESATSGMLALLIPIYCYAYGFSSGNYIPLIMFGLGDFGLGISIVLLSLGV